MCIWLVTCCDQTLIVIGQSHEYRRDCNKCNNEFPIVAAVVVVVVVVVVNSNSTHISSNMNEVKKVKKKEKKVEENCQGENLRQGGGKKRGYGGLDKI